MLHLLTEEHRQKIVKEYKKRIVVTLCLSLVFVTFTGIVFMMPSFFVAYGKYSEFKNKDKTLEKDLSMYEDSKSSENIKSITASIDALKMFDSKKDTYELLENLLQNKPEGIQIKNIVFTSNNTTIDLLAKANTRRDLVVFDEKLKANPHFDQVLVPLGSFAKERNIEFSMKLIVSTSTQNDAVSEDSVIHNEYE